VGGVGGGMKTNNKYGVGGAALVNGGKMRIAYLHYLAALARGGGASFGYFQSESDG
jgi:hypothetical protein